MVWPSMNLEDWHETCDTLHGHTQVLGKLAATLAPPEPQLQHAALRQTVRGWETAPLPAPDGSGALVVALDLCRHVALVETSGGATATVELTPHRSVGAVTRELLAAVAALAGAVEIDPTPQEVEWMQPLDADEDHARYETDRVAVFFEMATRAALVLAAYRAPYRGRATPVNAWWGSFDLAVGLFSGKPAEPPSEDFIMRNAMDSQEVAVGWWPGNSRYPRPAFYTYTHPPTESYLGGDLGDGVSRWDAELGEYVLAWEDVVASPEPHETALRFARAGFEFACRTSEWDPELVASAESSPPPLR